MREGGRERGWEGKKDAQALTAGLAGCQESFALGCNGSFVCRWGHPKGLSLRTLEQQGTFGGCQGRSVNIWDLDAASVCVYVCGLYVYVVCIWCTCMCMWGMCVHGVYVVCVWCGYVVCVCGMCGVCMSVVCVVFV